MNAWQDLSSQVIRLHDLLERFESVRGVEMNEGDIQEALDMLRKTPTMALFYLDPQYGYQGTGWGGTYRYHIDNKTLKFLEDIKANPHPLLKAEFPEYLQTWYWRANPVFFETQVHICSRLSDLREAVAVDTGIGRILGDVAQKYVGI